MKKILILVLVLLMITSVYAEEKKAAEIKVGDGAFKGSNPVVLGAWLAYGSARSKFVSCDNYQYSFKEEFAGRNAMLDFWIQKNGKGNLYLDELGKIKDAGFLNEYVAYFFFKNQANLTSNQTKEEFMGWFEKAIPKHRVQTHVKVVQSDACTSLLNK